MSIPDQIGFPFNRNLFNAMVIDPNSAFGRFRFPTITNGLEINSPLKGDVTIYTVGSELPLFTGGTVLENTLAAANGITHEDFLVISDGDVRICFNGILGNDKAVNKGKFNLFENLGIVQVQTPKHFFMEILKVEPNGSANLLSIEEVNARWVFRPENLKDAPAPADLKDVASGFGLGGLVIGGMLIWAFSKGSKK